MNYSSFLALITVNSESNLLLSYYITAVYWANMILTFENFKIERIIGYLSFLGAAAIISFSLVWNFTSNHSGLRFFGILIVIFCLIIAAEILGKIIFSKVVAKISQHAYWQTDFYPLIDKLYLIFSLFFLTTFSTNELFSVLYVMAILGLLFFRLDHYFSLHPDVMSWRPINRNVFILIFFIFSTSCFFQYYAYKNYVLELQIENRLMYYAVALRSLTITMFWLFGFSLSGIIYQTFKRKFRLLFIFGWFLFFVILQLYWVINIGLLHYSGIYLSPLVIKHAEGAQDVLKNRIGLVLFLMFTTLFYIFVGIVIRLNRTIKVTPKKIWYFYNVSILILAMLSLTILPFYKNTPEYLTAKSFYRYYKKPKNDQSIDPEILKKLEKFGFFYNQENSYDTYKEKTYSGQEKFLASKFLSKKPNVLIVFFESLSSRLTGVYNEQNKALTPGLINFSQDKNTTIFRKYYNASTPTVTGVLSQLCSFLPPTGQDDINKQGNTTYDYPCLPELLKKYGNYKSATYVTAVKKDYAHKGTIIENTGVDEILGTDELSGLIKEAPKSWGYSDHQMFPVFLKLAQEKKDPFLLMLSTIDTHPPYNLSRDMGKFGDGKSNLLNSVRSTDDAFSKFWEDFKKSELYSNTILITVADHAIFPAAYSSDTEKKLLLNSDHRITFYDENLFMVYVPDSKLPKEIKVYSSGIDFSPTVLNILDLNVPNFFEGLSILGERKKYPNILGMNEYELFINQENPDGTRNVQFGPPNNIRQIKTKLDPSQLSLYEYLQFYNWKKSFFNLQ